MKFDTIRGIKPKLVARRWSSHYATTAVTSFMSIYHLHESVNTDTHTYTHLTTLCLGLPG